MRLISAFLLSVCIVSISLSSAGLGDDWPTDRADAARSGYTAEAPHEQPALAWQYRATHPPRSAWPTRRRLVYDRAFRVVAADGRVYFGSSADDKVYALDARTGQVLWTFFADGPIRFAPVVWQDNLFVVSDDGFLYCLDTTSGTLRWKLRGGPRDDMLLGNDRMVSRWPARGGPVVADGVLYFAAGLWPSEGIYIYALDPKTGNVLWCNDTAGGIEMDQPHGGARAKSGVSAQGHFAAAGQTLLVPTGRAVPAAFNRKNGKLRYFHLQANRARGGSEIAVIDGHFFNQGEVFSLKTGEFEAALGLQVAAHPKWIVASMLNRPNMVQAVDRRRLLVEKDSVDRKGRPIKIHVRAPVAWKTKLPLKTIHSLIVAADRVVAGGEGGWVMLDVDSGGILHTEKLDGTVHSLAVAGGRLYASTDRGVISCYDRATGVSPNIVTQPNANPTDQAVDPAMEKAADEIVRQSGVTEGYCVDLGCGQGDLALALARKTKLHLYAVDSDPVNVRAAREKLDAAGLYGVRVTVHQADPAEVPYADYVADLVVSGRSVAEGNEVFAHKTADHLLRPWGGVARWGQPGRMKQITRGPLPGAGRWTHQYADAGNTLCSSDRNVAGGLQMLWFRDTDFFMPNRHGRGPAPLVDQGRMFAEGVDALRAVNAYNGRTLWEYPLKGVLKPYHQEHLMGTAGTQSNFCLGEGRVFLHDGKMCLVLDAATGRRLATIQPPTRPDGKPSVWGYIAYYDGLLYGTLANTKYHVQYRFLRSDMRELYTESIGLFAVDPTTGKVVWTHTPKHSIRHNAIAIGAGRVHLIDRPPALIDTPAFSPKTRKGRDTLKKDGKPEHPPGRLVALDAKTGEPLWRSDKTIFGTLLALNTEHNVLLSAYQATRFRLDSEVGGRMAAHRASDGQPMWDIEADYESRPLLIDRTIYAQPGAWDLMTGRKLAFDFKRSYGCGTLSSSQRMLLFRSATLGYRDLDGPTETFNYGGIRPGCWINVIPAGGIVVMADAASWCTCSYLNQATIALQPR
ncbi:MAG: PQQ-binding-like beta-propeller repeat protein [Pirellulales bacterium]|nr:PQQ-binding-like beta-propeller repeat protein [Pirellulales bacterium]